jgi:hypothetical protein
MVAVEALLEVVLNMYQKSASFNHEDFSGKEQNLHSWNYSQVPDYQDFQIIRCQIKGILLY